MTSRIRSFEVPCHDTLKGNRKKIKLTLILPVTEYLCAALWLPDSAFSDPPFPSASNGGSPLPIVPDRIGSEAVLSAEAARNPFSFPAYPESVKSRGNGSSGGPGT